MRSSASNWDNQSMSKVDWSVLGTLPKGLAVEGRNDKQALEAFLDAGEKARNWSDWRKQIAVIAVGTVEKILEELDGSDARIWGLIDRDWRTDEEIADLTRQHPQLLVLPRVMIENYCIAPDELAALLPPAKQVEALETRIEAHRDDWIQNGALWRVLHQNGAHEFCKGHEQGYPMAVLHRPVVHQAEIETRLRDWHSRLDPDTIMTDYRTLLDVFRAEADQNYSHHIHGKNFFHQVIVQKVLNPTFEQRKADQWFETLFSAADRCPDDIVPVLKRLVS